MTITANKFDYSSTGKEALASVMVREMSISVERFAKRLTHVARGVVGEEKIASGRYKFKSSDGSIAITCEKMPNRYIGLLTIPVIKIELDFNHYDTSQIESFMRKFDRAYLELGG
jgi:hypothetical protein